MSKVICDVCGTSYPETASQCPICGCVRPGEAHSVMDDAAENETNTGYMYVKGGRFSRSNVRKRNKLAGNSEPAPVPSEHIPESDNKENKGLIITAVILLLAIVAVLIYIVTRFFLPAGDQGRETTEGTDSMQPSTSETTVLTIPCQKLNLDIAAITFDKAGAARMIYVSAEPVNTTDEITYTSSDEAVATVSAEGKVTAVGPGQAVITISCGDITTQCMVNCIIQLPTEDTTVPDTTEDTTVPEVEFRLNRADITFAHKGDSWMLYSGNLGLTQITWTSDDEAVAKITNGKVVAVGSGTTTVYGEYNGEKIGCIIRCSFSDSSDSNTGSSGNVTEDGPGTSESTFSLKNTAGGSNEDVTITVGYSFTLQLVDANGNAVSGATWKTSDEALCTVSDGYVTGTGAGVATVTATYNGKTYSCIVRIY